MGKLLEKQLRNFDDKEQIVLFQYMKSEEIREKLLPLQAISWANKNCKELSNIRDTMLAENKERIPPSAQLDGAALYKKISDAQHECMGKYADSGICTKCKKSTKNISKAAKGKMYLIDALFFNIYACTGLCIDCQVEFLHENLKEHAAKIDDNTVNMFRQRVTPKVYTNLWDAFFH
jgi:hypothetical protein